MCSYIGQLITDPMAEKLNNGKDQYIFTLDHFTKLFVTKHDNPEEVADIPPHQWPPAPDENLNEQLLSRMDLMKAQAQIVNPSAVESEGEEQMAAANAKAVAEAAFLPPDGFVRNELRSDLLAVDANKISNVVRYINHSCEPNLTIQAVFAKQCRSLLFYYTSFFAERDIPAGEELCYTYGSDMTHVINGRCACGSSQCHRARPPAGNSNQ